jgi:aspartate kinase
VSIDSQSRIDNLVDDLKEFSTVTVDHDMVIICVVGDLEWHNGGFEAKAIEALGDIPLRMISYGGSNYNIAVVVRKDDKILALNRLSENLFNKN